MKKLEDNEIRLSPMSRMTMTFDTELNLDKNGVFGRETYDGYIKRYGEALQKQDQLIRSLCIQAALLFLILNGQSWTLPIIGIQISEIPAVLEIILFSVSMTFYLLCATFVTSQCYSGIIDQYGNRIVDSSRVDPDFFNASRKYFEFFLKLYRPKMNIWGVDFYQHKWSFSVFSGLMNLITLAVLLLMPITHLVLVSYASLEVYNSDWNAYAKWFLLVSIMVVNFGGLALVFGMNTAFTFKILEPSPDSELDVKPDQLPK